MAQEWHTAALSIYTAPLNVSILLYLFYSSFFYRLYTILDWILREKDRAITKEAWKIEVKKISTETWKMRWADVEGGEKEWRRWAKSCTFQCRLSPEDDATWQTIEWAFNNLSTLLNALPLFLFPSLSLSLALSLFAFHLSSSHPPLFNFLHPPFESLFFLSLF